MREVRCTNDNSVMGVSMISHFLKFQIVATEGAPSFVFCCAPGVVPNRQMQEELPSLSKNVLKFQSWVPLRRFPLGIQNVVEVERSPPGPFFRAAGRRLKLFLLSKCFSGRLQIVPKAPSVKNQNILTGGDRRTAAGWSSMISSFF